MKYNNTLTNIPDSFVSIVQSSAGARRLNHRELLSFVDTVISLVRQHANNDKMDSTVNGSDGSARQRLSALLDHFLPFLHDPSNEQLHGSLIDQCLSTLPTVPTVVDGNGHAYGDNNDDQVDTLLYFMLHFGSALTLWCILNNSSAREQTGNSSRLQHNNRQIHSLRKCLLHDYQLYDQVSSIGTASKRLHQLRSKLKQWIILRLFHHINYSIVRFMISIFGSRLAPQFITRLLTLFNVTNNVKQQHNNKNRNGKSGGSSGIQVWQWKAYGGFVLGTLFGAMSSTVPLTVSQKIQSRLLNRVGAVDQHMSNNLPIQLTRALPLLHGGGSRDTYTSEQQREQKVVSKQAFWLMVGSFVGLLMNFGARYGAHRAVLYFLNSQLPSVLLSRHVAIGDDSFNRMILRTVTGMYRSYVDSFIYPQIAKKYIEVQPSSSPASQADGKKIKKNGGANSGMDLSMVMSMLGMDSQTVLNQIPMYNESRVARALINRYVLPVLGQSKKGGNVKVGAPTGKYAKQFPRLAKVGNTIRDTYERTARIIQPVEDNASWNNLSARTALWFSGRFSTPRYTDTNAVLLGHQLNSLMSQVKPIVNGEQYPKARL